MSENNKLLKNTTIYALGDIVPRLLAFISFPILVTYLTPADYGIVSYINTILTVLMTIGFLCLNTYYLVYYYRQKDEIAQKRLLGNLSCFVVAINVIFVAILLIVGPLFFTFLESNIDFYPYITLGIATHFVSIFSILPSALYRLQERPLLFTILNSSRGLLQVSLTLLLVVVYGYDAIGVLWANFIVAAIFAVVFIIITYRHAIICFDWSQIKSALKFSLPLLPGSIAYFLISMSDRILIDKYLNLTELGIYSTASTLALLLNILSYGAYKAFEPHFFKTYGTAGFENSFSKIRDAFTCLLLFGVLGLSIFAREFFEIMASDKFSSAYYYVPMILIGVFASSIGMLYGTIITARENTKINSAITIIGGCVSVSLNILLMPYFGLIGASLVSGVTFVLMLLASIYYSNLRVKHGRTIVAAIFSAVVIFLIVYAFPIDDFWYSLSVKIVVFLVANLVVLRVFGLNIKKLLLSLRSRVA